MVTFSIKTKILFGDMLREITQGFSRVFIVTDEFMSQSGKVGYVTERLATGTESRIFSDVSADPDIATITKGVTLMSDFHPGAIIAFGGGSPIDAAKAIMYFFAKVQKTSAPVFIAVPTTSGTGSEVSRFAVITDTEKQVKCPIVDDGMIPDFAVLDAELIKSAPPSITADTGMDVLTHALEALVSAGANDFTDAMAQKAVQLVLQHLITAHKEPDNTAAREGMHNASCLAGIAFSSAELGLTHSMAHALGARFHLPHGRANAILLPYVMSYNAGFDGALTDVAKTYADIARSLGMEVSCTRNGAQNLFRMVRNYSEKIGIPTSIRDAGIDQKEFNEALESMTLAALADRCTATNPRQCSAEDVVLIFKAAYLGKHFVSR